MRAWALESMVLYGVALAALGVVFVVASRNRTRWQFAGVAVLALGVSAWLLAVLPMRAWLATSGEIAHVDAKSEGLKKGWDTVDGTISGTDEWVS